MSWSVSRRLVFAGKRFLGSPGLTRPDRQLPALLKIANLLKIMNLTIC